MRQPGEALGRARAEPDDEPPGARRRPAARRPAPANAIISGLSAAATLPVERS